MDALISADTVLAALHWRYAVKKFDSSRRLDDTQWGKLEEALTLSASSYGLQPYRFVVVQDTGLREQLLAHSYGQGQVVECSHLVVFATRTDITAEDVDRYMDRITEVRGVSREHLEGFRKVIVGDLVEGPRHAQIEAWCARQAYIALGNLLTTAALLGVDTCPMEGISVKKYTELLGLEGSGYNAVVVAAVGFRAPDDGAASLPKVRFPNEVLIQHR